MIQNEKLSVHRVDRKKPQLNNQKEKFEQNIIDIDEYISAIAKTKE